MTETTKEKIKTDKVVVHVNGRTIKGYIESTQWESLDGLLVQGTRSMPEVVHIRPADGSDPVDLPIEQTKAIFFVKSFGGGGARRGGGGGARAPGGRGGGGRGRGTGGEIM